MLYTCAQKSRRFCSASRKIGKVCMSCGRAQWALPPGGASGPRRPGAPVLAQPELQNAPPSTANSSGGLPKPPPPMPHACCQQAACERNGGFLLPQACGKRAGPRPTGHLLKLNTPPCRGGRRGEIHCRPSSSTSAVLFSNLKLAPLLPAGPATVDGKILRNTCTFFLW